MTGPTTPNAAPQTPPDATTNTTEGRYAVRHPAWCDRTRCTANPAAMTGAGYRPGTAGQHQSAPIRLDLTCAFRLPSPAGEAYLTQAVAPWPCSPYLRIRVGDSKIAMPVEHATPALSALNMLTAVAEAGEVAAR